MKNLRVIHHLAYQDELERPPSAYCWDVGSNSVICTYGPTECDTLIELKRWQDQAGLEPQDADPQLIASWDAPSPLPDQSSDQVLNLQYFADTSTACLVLAGGDIVLVREKPVQGEEKIEIVGSIDVGIAAAAWAPDEELLVICSRGDTVLFMTRDFDSSETVELLEDDLKASKHVSVGWGKKETQFQGKGAKALRDPTVPERVDEGVPSSQENHVTTISWRGDGQYVAINSTQKSTRRVTRVYTRDGVLDAVSEPVDFFDPALSWRPAGNIIAGIQRKGSATQVVFFERNGLRHGQFPLRLSEADCETWASSISLNWNVDSTALAVCFKDRVQLWTMSNYHYSMKQEIRLSEAPGSQLCQVSWHPESPLAFAVGSPTGHIHRFEVISSVCCASTLELSCQGAVAVIDGASLKLTPLRHANLPPPMALHEIDVGSPLVDVGFCNRSTKELTLVALTLTDLVLFDWNTGANTEVPVQRGKISLTNVVDSDDGVPRVFQQVQLVRQDLILLLHSSGSSSIVTRIHVEDTSMRVDGTHTLPLVQELACVPGESGLVSVIHHDGRILHWAGIHNLNGSSAQEHPGAFTKIACIKAPIEKSEIAELAQNLLDSKPSSAIISFSLTKGGQLFANDCRIASGCMSFLVTAAHVIFTTSQHLLKFVHLTHVDALEVPPDTPETDERCRSVERGAKLVTVIPSTSALVLQMPRGNLETIYPRALVLAEIRRSVDGKHYLKAFKACRSHRVDMNIIHDYKPQQFLHDVPLFIEQVRKVEYIDLFLSQLREDDVASTLYKETLRSASKNASGLLDSKPDNGELAESKVNRICSAFLKALRPLLSSNLQNLITAHVCKMPPDLASGLKEVAKLQKGDSKQAELAVEHICFLVDVNKLFDAALGLYDIQLALLVAQQAQKDPKEYLPFLQKLSEHPKLKMKFEIDNHLGRYRLCLEHLKEMGDFTDFKSFMVKHAFYGEALSMYKYDEHGTDEIMKLYAEYLSSNSRHHEAGVTYEYLRDYTAAHESYQLANSWREALSCANAIPLAQEEVKNLAAGLVEGLTELKDYYSAATIKLDYLSDPKGAAQLFCKGYHFADAIRVLYVHGQIDAVASIVDVGLIEAMASTTEMLAECKAQLNAQIPRLSDLRLKKEQDPLAFYDADVNGGAEIPDNVSLARTDASTVGSTLFTRYTNRSGTVGTNASRKSVKNKRKEERKRARGKKGSVYEEEYLVNSIGRLTERINSIGEDVSKLITGLIRRRMMERARAVELAMLAVVDLCKECIPEVFQVERATENEAKQDRDSHVNPAQAEGLDVDRGFEETRTKVTPPTVRPFEGLAILRDKP